MWVNADGNGWVNSFKVLRIRLLPSQLEVLEGSGNTMLFSNVKPGWSLPSLTAGCQIVSFQYIIFWKKI